EDKFVLSGKAFDTLSQYDYKAFRYAEIDVPDGVKIDEESIVFTVRHYPFTETKHYTGNNEKLAKIYKLCSDTIKYGTQECFVDCPTREKGQYLGDVTIAGIASLELTGNPAIIKKALENYCESSFICKGLMTVAPSSLMQEIADYSLQFPFQVLWVYKYTKDIEFLKKMYPYVMNVYNYFADYRMENGLLSGVKPKWNLIDWPKNLRDNYDFPEDRPVVDGFHNVINGFYLAMLKHIDEIRAILGIEPTGKTEKTAKGYVEAFYDKEQKVFVDSVGSKHASYHSNVLALFASAIVDDENKKAVLELIESKKLTCGGVYMAFFALYGLKLYGETELMEKLMTDDGAWMNMISEGATTCFEAWGKDQKWNTSLFHPWASAPAIILG
ncbi:MAG: alpha-L-rhamnosidase, partial [Clostridia bacterium]|nr:alpha-L-rhamnosidase [Clostridia bacterium]